MLIASAGLGRIPPTNWVATAAGGDGSRSILRLWSRAEFLEARVDDLVDAERKVFLTRNIARARGELRARRVGPAKYWLDITENGVRTADAEPSGS